MTKKIIPRREFIKTTCSKCGAAGIGLLLGSALFEAGCKASAALTVYKTAAKENKVEVPLSMFESANFRMVRVAGYEYDIGLQKEKDGSFIALLLMCTHAGQALNKAGSGYYCTLHGSRFSQDGDVVKGPASHPLIHLPVSIIGQSIFINLDNPTT